MNGSRKVWSVLAVAMLCVSGTMSAFGHRGSDDGPGDDNDGRGGGSGGGSNSGGGGGSGGGRDLRLVSQLRDTDTAVRARVRYRQRGSSIKGFDIELKRAQPGETFAVVVDGTSFGTITANNFGIAKVEFRRSPSGPNEMAIPAGFPLLQVGDAVSVGDMNGAFVVGN